MDISIIYMKKVVKNTLFVAIAVMLSQTMHAVQLTPQQALARVSIHSTSALSAEPEEAEPVFEAKSESSGVTAFYVFNNSGRQGYTIVSASAETEPILGYTTAGSFDYDLLPPAMKWWLEQYQEQIEYAETHNGTAPGGNVRIAQAAENARADIAPLVGTQWNQGSPYNQYCPVLQGVQAPTGCVATAMAQIMRYHQWPEKGKGSNSYDFTYSYNKDGQTLSATASEQMDFSQTTFNWSDMTYSYNANSTDNQKDAVATLMHACGVSVNMGYGQNASGAQSRRLPGAYMSNFDYDKSVFYYERQYFTTAQWEKLIYNELAAGRPVQYSGHNDESGHSFVCDGYQDGGYFHINWGWGGISDGYFRLSALDPSTQGIGGSASGYNAGQGAVVNIQKPKASSDYIYCVVSSAGLSAQNETVDRDASITIYPNTQGEKVQGTVFYNNSAVAISSIYFGVKIKNRTTGSITWHASFAYNNLDPNTGFSSISVPGSAIESSGTYEISPAYSLDEGATWNDIMLAKSAAQYILLTVTDSDITVATPSTEAKLRGEIKDIPGQMVQNGQYNVNVAISNSGSYFNNDIYLAFLILSSDGSSATIAHLGGASVAEIESGSNAETEIRVNTTDLTVGTVYQVALLCEDSNSNYKIISDLYPVTITEQGTVTASVSIDYLVNGRVPMNDIRINGSARSLNGGFCNSIQLVIFENFDDDGDGYVKGVGTIQTEVLNIPSGETVNFKATGSIANGQPGRQYYVRPRINGQNAGSPFVFTLGDEETGIETVSADSVGVLTISPNPATDVVVVSAPASVKSVAVYSLNGAMLFNRDFDGSESVVEINVADLSAGHYLLRVITQKGTVATHLLKK